MTMRAAGNGRRGSKAIGAVLAMLLSGIVVVVSPTPAQAAVNHGQTVPERPRRNLPKIRDGEVLAADRVGNRLVVGGTFTSIERPDGTFVTQPYLAAFDINTGALDENFRPQIDGRVLTIEAGAGWDEVFIGGGFKNIDGVRRVYAAKLDVDAGTVDTSWKANATGWVYELSRFDDRLFMGGNFKKVRGVSHERLAEVNTTNGALASGFGLNITGERVTGCRTDGWCQTNPNSPMVQGLEVTPDGSTLVVMHAGDRVGLEERWGVALIDISGATAAVRPWKTNLWPASDFVGITDGALSPDGSYVVLATKIGNFPPLHDTAIRFEVGPATWNNTNMQPTWVTQNFDSTFAVTISDAAVYIGGHFCWTEGPGSSPAGWPGSAGNRYSCEAWGGGSFPNTVYRYHQAALDPATGTALPWDSPANSFTGSKFMQVIDRGLLVGHDGSRMDNIDVGRFGFYDLGIEYDDTPPPPADPTCTAEVSGTTVTVTWDDDTADRWAVRRDGGWVATVNAPATSHADLDVADGTHSYVLRQLNGPRDDIPCGDVLVENPQVDPTCAAEVSGTTVTVTWVDDQSTRWAVRRNGSWVATVNAPTAAYVHNDVPNGTHTYVLRQLNGDRDDLPCGDVVVVDAPPADEAAPDTTLTRPIDGEQLLVGAEQITGTAIDNVGVTRVQVRVRNRDTGEYLHADGTWGGWAQIDAVLETPGATSTNWSLDVNLTAARYKVWARGLDAAGNRDASQAIALFTAG